MKTSENIYTALTLVFAGFLAAGILNFQLLIIPITDNPDVIPVFHFVCAILGLCAASLGVTSFLNLKNKSLGTVSTIIQISVFFLMVYGIPFAIWGIVLLVKSKNSANN